MSQCVVSVFNGTALTKRMRTVCSGTTPTPQSAKHKLYHHTQCEIPRYRIIPNTRAEQNNHAIATQLTKDEDLPFEILTILSMPYAAFLNDDTAFHHICGE